MSRVTARVTPLPDTPQHANASQNNVRILSTAAGALRRSARGTTGHVTHIHDRSRRSRHTHVLLLDGDLDSLRRSASLRCSMLSVCTLSPHIVPQTTHSDSLTRPSARPRRPPAPTPQSAPPPPPTFRDPTYRVTSSSCPSSLVTISRTPPRPPCWGAHDVQ